MKPIARKIMIIRPAEKPDARTAGVSMEGDQLGRLHCNAFADANRFAYVTWNVPLESSNA